MNPPIRNVANKTQVKKAAVDSKKKEEQDIEDIKEVLKLSSGRRWVWKILTHCKVFGSIYHNSSLIHYQSGMQDVGHFVLTDIIKADPDFLLQMMTEAKGEYYVGR